jgi:hypothetical protein
MSVLRDYAAVWRAAFYFVAHKLVRCSYTPPPDALVEHILSDQHDHAEELKDWLADWSQDARMLFFRSLVR